MYLTTYYLLCIYLGSLNLEYFTFFGKGEYELLSVLSTTAESNILPNPRDSFFLTHVTALILFNNRLII